MPFSSTTPPVKKGVLKSPQAFQNPKLKNLFSADDAQSKAERIPNRFQYELSPRLTSSA